MGNASQSTLFNGMALHKGFIGWTCFDWMHDGMFVHILAIAKVHEAYLEIAGAVAYPSTVVEFNFRRE